MVLKANQATHEIKTNMRGGNGDIALHHVLTTEQMGKHGRICAQITLQPGDSIGYHEHIGESETFYIISGEGMLSDNGTSVMIHAGDSSICPNGEGHSIENTGTTPLLIFALVLYEL